MSGEHQVNLNLSLTLVDVKLVNLCFAYKSSTQETAFTWNIEKGKIAGTTVFDKTLAKIQGNF